MSGGHFTLRKVDNICPCGVGGEDQALLNDSNNLGFEGREGDMTVTKVDDNAIFLDVTGWRESSWLETAT